MTKSRKDDFNIICTTLENIIKVISSPEATHYSSQETLREERDLIQIIYNFGNLRAEEDQPERSSNTTMHIICVNEEIKAPEF